MVFLTPVIPLKIKNIEKEKDVSNMAIVVKVSMLLLYISTWKIIQFYCVTEILSTPKLVLITSKWLSQNRVEFE
jgi:hypothetical protein